MPADNTATVTPSHANSVGRRTAHDDVFARAGAMLQANRALDERMAESMAYADLELERARRLSEVATRRLRARGLLD